MLIVVSRAPSSRNVLTVLDRHTPITSQVTSNSVPVTMRLSSFLLVLVITLLYCQTMVSADKSPKMSYNYELSTADNVKHYLKDIKEPSAEEERAFPGASKLRGFLSDIAEERSSRIAVEKFKTLVLDKKTRHASVSVAISLLKMLAFVGAVSVTSGYIIYRVSNS